MKRPLFWNRVRATSDESGAFELMYNALLDVSSSHAFFDSEINMVRIAKTTLQALLTLQRTKPTELSDEGAAFALMYHALLDISGSNAFHSSEKKIASIAETALRTLATLQQTQVEEPVEPSCRSLPASSSSHIKIQVFGVSNGTWLGMFDCAIVPQIGDRLTMPSTSRSYMVVAREIPIGCPDAEAAIKVWVEESDRLPSALQT